MWYGLPTGQHIVQSFAAGANPAWQPSSEPNPRGGGSEPNPEGGFVALDPQPPQAANATASANRRGVTLFVIIVILL
jgi:hypothetical protein